MTGAASGLGEAMAKALLKSGASVLALDVNDDRISQSFARVAGGGRGRSMKFDVRKRRPLRRSGFAGATRTRRNTRCDKLCRIGMPHLRPDYHTRPLRFWEADPQKWQDVVDINMRGPFLLARAAAPFMIEQKWAAS